MEMPRDMGDYSLLIRPKRWRVGWYKGETRMGGKGQMSEHIYYNSVVSMQHSDCERYLFLLLVTVSLKGAPSC